MQVDPINHTYSDPVDLETMTEAMREQQEAVFAKAVEEGQVVARSSSHDALLALQADLRKRGYRSQR